LLPAAIVDSLFLFCHCKVKEEFKSATESNKDNFQIGRSCIVVVQEQNHRQVVMHYQGILNFLTFQLRKKD